MISGITRLFFYLNKKRDHDDDVNSKFGDSVKSNNTKTGNAKES